MSGNSLIILWCSLTRKCDWVAHCEFVTLIMCASTFSPRNNIPQLLKWSTASSRESQHRAPEKGRHITTQIITSHKEKKQYRILTPRHAIIKAFSYLPQVTLSMDLLHPGVCSIPKFQLLTLSLANTTFNFTWLDQSGRAMVHSLLYKSRNTNSSCARKKAQGNREEWQ